jgi:hypothetical protein
MENTTRPATGDIVIWDMEPEQASSVYWVRRHGRGSATQLFDGPDAWGRAWTTARDLAGPGRTVWSRRKDGHFEALVEPV